MKKTLLLWLLLLAACGDDPPPPPGQGPASLWIKNDSQYLLDEVRVHQQPEYLETPNMLQVPLPIGIELLHRGSGSFYITVIRERFNDGPPVALTTLEAIELFDSSGYRLAVFDESFRLTDAPFVPVPELPEED